MKTNTINAVPKLRFPEFMDDKDWLESSLSQVCNMKAGTFVSASEIKDMLQDSLYPCYGGNGLRGFTKTYTHNGVFPLIGRQGALCGNITLSHGQFHATEHAVVCTPKKNIDVIWLYYQLVLLDLNQYATGQAQPGLSVKNLNDIPLRVPDSLKEQQKVADFLSSLDDSIDAEIKQLESLKIHKAGLSQNLFPVGEEIVPKYRFPEFENQGGWKENKLDSVATFLNGKAYKKSELLGKGKYKVIRVGNFFSNREWYYSDLELEENKYCDNGDLLYAWSASFGPRIWKGNKSIYHYHIWKVLPKSNVHKGFLYFLLDYHTLKMKSESANGLGLLHITKGTIEGWNCFTPKYDEQQKIADCLSSLDNLIESQTNKIEILKQHKQGLMQQLFPVMED